MTLDKNLVAYYRLEDVQDVSGNGYTLTNTSVTFSTGKLNNGGVFDGSASRLQSTTNLAQAGNFTVSFWDNRS